MSCEPSTAQPASKRALAAPWAEVPTQLLGSFDPPIIGLSRAAIPTAPLRRYLRWRPETPRSSGEEDHRAHSSTRLPMIAILDTGSKYRPRKAISDLISSGHRRLGNASRMRVDMPTKPARSLPVPANRKGAQ